MRIVLDAKYPGILADARALLERCFPWNSVDAIPAHGGTCFHLSMYSRHLPCLFPQHGPGPKHERSIVLEPWQEEIVKQVPWPFIRGCIRTDGCAFINRTGPYEYLSYDFCNVSKEIIGLFVGACDQVGVMTRVNGGSRIWRARINRRESVELMLCHVGVKT